MDQAIILTILGIVATIIIGLWQIYLAHRQVEQSNSIKDHGQLLSTLSQVSTSQSPSLWLPTNHSQATINYKPVVESDVRTKIDRILREFYGAYVGRIYKIELVNEPSATLNYRVQGFAKKPILLRFHKIVSSEQALVALQSIQRHVFESGVFSDSPINNCLIPLPSTSGRTFEQSDNQLIEVYPFADGVVHYSGKSLTQVENLARKYGLVQKALRDLDAGINLSLLGNLHPYMSWFQGDQSLFDLICKINGRAILKSNPDSFSLLFGQYQSFLKKVWHEVKPYLAQEADILPKPILHNFHPHNTFFQGDKCVLIYDYDPVLKNTSEVDALAFALHRFIREYLRSLLQRGHVEVEAEIPAVVDTFLEHYSLAGLPVPPDFKNNLSLAIKKTNLARLLQIMSVVYRMANDGDRRDERIWYAELVKFISYLEEAEHFNIQKN